MKGNFPAALARILVYEGGKVDNPKDPGGRTNFGITQRTYDSWRRLNNKAVQDVYNITHDEVATIYETEYWNRIEGDSLPSGLDLVVFDGAVNSGPGSSIMWLQAALGNVSIDGGMGTKTLAAAMACDPETTLNSHCERRLGSLERLSTWSTFGKGWSARISNVKKIGDAWAEDGTGINSGPAPVMVSDLGGHTKANMDDVKTNTVAAVTAHAVTVGGAVSDATTQAVTALTGVGDTFNWLKYVLGGLTVIGAISGVVVMVAKTANDNATNGVAVAKVDPSADDRLTPVMVEDEQSPASPIKAVQASPAATATKA